MIREFRIGKVSVLIITDRMFKQYKVERYKHLISFYFGKCSIEIDFNNRYLPF